MDQHAHKGGHANPYMLLAGMAGLSFIAMYVLMYSMVNTLGEVFNSINQVYMAGLMAAPMVIIEIVLMRSMYPNKKLNGLIAAASVVALVGFFALIRYQGGVGDRQFLRSMIPHHSGAILMCREATIQSAELKQLCHNIIKSQADEIAQMRRLLDKP